MVPDRRMGALVLVALLCCPVWGARAGDTGCEDTGADSGDAPAPRGEWTQYADQILELQGSGSTFANASFTIPIPSNATILSASVELEGRPVESAVTSVTYDFSDYSEHKAYKGEHSSNSPGSTKPSSFQGAEFMGSEYGALASSDNSRAIYYSYYSSYGYHLFRFKVGIDITTKVSVEWEGFGGYPYGSYYPGIATVYIWNNGTGGSGSWETVGSHGPASSDKTLTNTFSGSYYVASTGSGNYVYVLALCTGGQYYYGIASDYVKVVVEGKTLTYPKNPAMDIGANGGQPEWRLYDEKFDERVSVGDVSISNELEKLAKGARTEYVEIKVKFTSAAPGRMLVSRFTVSYNSPPWCTGIPDTFHLSEDTEAPKLIDLNNYFTDDRDRYRLSFTIIYEEDSKKLDADIDADGHSMSFKTPTRNWWGRARFRVMAMDSDSMTRESNDFTVAVDPVNDPPVITPVGRQLAAEDTVYTLQVRCRDVDMELDPEEQVTFSDDTALFDIDPVTGVAEFTPRQEQVGTYTIQVVAKDREEATDTETFTLEIQDTQDPPVLEAIPDQSATEGQPFTYTAAVSDPDIPYGDNLTFSDNTPLFQIDPESGLISFTPSTRDIGEHKVTITVADSRGGTDSRSFTLSVHNTMGTFNRPPTVEPVENQTAHEGIYFELQIRATDPDLDIGDILSFSDNCPVFEIGASTGRISFKPAAKDAGVYNVKVTVRDREGLSAMVEFRLTVVKANTPPTVLEILPKDGAQVTAGKRVLLSVTAYDADRDSLNITWMDGEIVIGYGPNITYTFGESGTYIITIVTSDGKAEVVNETIIDVLEPGQAGRDRGSSPGFELMALCASALGALALGRRRRR
ncbi:MAG: Ig-like domain-containing protein [Thermoplasmatota archaeon]